eukprot:TRINITY_DN16133_c0_g1_i1.p1 TRINITY_DN16133_c0_g1~~TRINITY_DN16133_c0_g1_i1.p1  ORF type:complete len:720 (+),score=72.69 TRINITY_DN16133_c0_g1_i1:95-2161(+)
MAKLEEEGDLEVQGLILDAAPVDNYGATVPEAGKGPKELPFLMGRFQVSPEALLQTLVRFYTAFFVVNICADAAYFTTVDARFPKGLGHFYPSEFERQQSVSYTRQTLTVSMLRRIAIFCIVIFCIHFHVFAKVDKCMRWLTSLLVKLWEQHRCRCCDCFCAPCQWCMACLGKCCVCCCCCSPVRRCFAQHSGRELVHGSLYVALFAACFFLISGPFIYWSRMIDLDFGFANALTLTPSKLRQQLIKNLMEVLVFSIPGRFIYLAVLQFRHGWLGMWVATVVVGLIAQYNFAWIAPRVLGSNNIFPEDMFVVGRGFPLARTSDKAKPWISLNRVYFNTSKSSALGLSTNDKSPGQLDLRTLSNSSLAIVARTQGSEAPTVFAHTMVSVPNVSASNLLEKLDKNTWSVGDQSTRLGARSGKALRDKLFEFAKARNISIVEIYMIDGSHKDARANAFVGGIGGSFIGLYDTLFLGAHKKDDEEDNIGIALHILTGGDAGIQALSNFMVDEDVAEEDGQEVWSSAPTQAMTDDEIVAIFAHELAHPALGHLQQGMLLQFITSFVTYASLGWAVHSPLFAAALSLHGPVLHVGACAYSYVVSPPLEGIMKFFSDWLTRKNEYEADAYVAMMSQKYGKALQTSLAKLSVNSNQDPDMPFWYEALRADHPTVANRWANIEAVKLKEAHQRLQGS